MNALVGQNNINISIFIFVFMAIANSVSAQNIGVNDIVERIVCESKAVKSHVVYVGNHTLPYINKRDTISKCATIYSSGILEDIIKRYDTILVLSIKYIDSLDMETSKTYRCTLGYGYSSIYSKDNRVFLSSGDLFLHLIKRDDEWVVGNGFRLDDVW